MLTTELFRTALAHHQAGRLHQAEAGYRQILQGEPHHADALHMLGVIAHQAGKDEIAAGLISNAINSNPYNPYYYFNLGLALQAQDKPGEAIENYQKALSIKPDYAEAHYNLGLTFQAQGKLDEAVGSFYKAISLNPDYAKAYNNLGNALQAQGKLDEAVESYQRALSIKRDYAEAYSNLANVFGDQGKLDEAIDSYRKALAFRPDYVEAHFNLGLALQMQDKQEMAAINYRQALIFKPDYADAHNNLGVALQAQGKLDEAAGSFYKAILHNPDYADAHNNVGNVLKDQGRLDEAAVSYHQALALKPDFAEAHNNLGVVFQLQGELDEAVASFRQALALRPDFPRAYNNMGNALRDQGKLGEAAGSYQKALALKADYAEAYSNLLFLYGYHALLDHDEYLSRARGWEQACLPEQEREAAHGRVFRNKPPVGRRLKVGYVSGDYRQHAVSYFIEQLFKHHDRGRIELFAYSTHGQRDAVTERLQGLVEHWNTLMGISDAMARDRIEADGIDVLIDLSGHTAHNRLGVFARRAAPVQAHYLGFFASTGLTEMDYLIGDEILMPPEADSHYSEQVWRLPRIRASYDGKAEAPLPGWQASQDGTVWVGSFNNLGKLTPATLALWARVLHALPEGRLLLKTKYLADAGNRQRILDAMAAHGIPSSRIELRDRSATPDWPAHMAYYDRLDIALDPVGAHGGYTTTGDALWMGAPVITQEGDRMASRMTASMLSAIGHPEWIARSEAEYVDKVAALARDVEQRKALRSTQRERMARSPLCDARGLATCLENAYFEMFERWQEKRESAMKMQAE